MTADTTKQEKQAKNTSKEEEKRLYALDAISQLCYFSKINIDYISLLLPFLERGNLKDFMIYYRESEQNWLNKIMRSLKGYKMAGVDLHTEMAKDLDSQEMMAFFNIIGNLKGVQDLDSIDEIIQECKGINDLSPILINLKALIRNQKNKQEDGNV